ncbi:MAG: amidohydrolase [Actinobacteria bacterium]|nr:amidohydrolase [Actinomycetota bacterium]
MSDERLLIDWHMHTFLPEHPGPIWSAGLARRYGGDSSAVSGATFDDLDEARATSGIDVAVVIALKCSRHDMAFPNEHVAEYVQRRPHDTLGFASVDPGDATAVDELRYAIETLGLRGLKLSPPYQGVHPHSAESWRVLETAADLGIPVMWHQGGVFLPEGVLEYANPVLLDKVARSFPELTLIVAHGGQPWFTETIALMYKNPNVLMDISARFHRPWQLHNMLLAARDYGVLDRVLFGTDFPVLHPTFCLSALRDINTLTEGRLPEISEEVIEGIVYRRPLSLAGLRLPAVQGA